MTRDEMNALLDRLDTLHMQIEDVLERIAQDHGYMCLESITKIVDARREAREMRVHADEVYAQECRELLGETDG